MNSKINYKTTDIFRDTAVLTYARVLTMVTSLINGMVIARALTLIDYGIYSQTYIVLNLASTIFGMALPNCINYFLPQSNNEEEEKQIASNILFLCTILGLLTAIVIMLCSNSLASYFNEPKIRNILYLTAFIPGFTLISSIFDNIFIVRNKAQFTAIRRTIMSVIRMLVVIIIWQLGGGITSLFIAIVLIELLMAVYVIFAINKELTGLNAIRISKNFLVMVFNYTIPLALAGIVGTITLTIGQLFTTKIYGTEELAVYTNMTKELPITIIATSLTAVLMPMISRYIKQKEFDTLITTWNNAVELSFILTSWTVGILILLAPECITFLYSEKYLSGVDIFRIASITILFRVIYFGMILNGCGRTRIILYCSVGSLIVNISLLYILSHFIGIKAPVISMLLSVVFIAIVQLKLSCTCLHCSFKRIFPWKMGLKNLLLNCFIAIPCYIVALILREYNVHYVIVIIVITITWLLIYSSIYYKRIIYLRNQLRYTND